MKNSLYFVSNSSNFGDAINPFIFNKVLGLNVSHASEYNSNIFGIGSILQKAYIYNKNNKFLRNIWRNKKKYLNYFYNNNTNLFVFGSGFIDDFSGNLIKYKKIKYLAIRGKKSLSIVESLHGKLNYNPVTGDPGLLVEKLIQKPKKKKYEIGFIPHYIDQNTLSTKLILKDRKIKYINICDEPLTVLNQIAECETIISSALHGLIAADSLGIPNKWIKLSDKLMGNDFKFNDYYSVFNLSLSPLNLSCIDNFIIDKNKILDSYNIDQLKVEKIKKSLIDISKNFLVKGD